MKKNIEQVFKESLEDLKADARSAGMSLTSVCKAAGVARATPDRWAQNTPKTIKVLSKMQDTVAQRAAELQAADEGDQPSSEESNRE